MDIYNVERYLREHYDRHYLFTYRSIKKFYLRVESVRLDIQFLRTCRFQDIIPKFLWFKTANENLSSSSAYKESQRRLLNSKISHKHRHLDKMKKMYRYSIRSLAECCSPDLFESLKRTIIARCAPLLLEKEAKIKKKLSVYCRYFAKRKPSVNREVVTNLSARILSDEELDCLAHGLDYGLVPRRFDEMNAVGNIEQFFHQICLKSD